MSDIDDRMAGLDPDRLARLAEANKVAAHDAPEQEPEQEGAPRFQPGHVLEALTGGYLVLSRTVPGCWWMVHGSTCSCPAGRSGHERCWHRSQVAAFVRRVNEKLARPVAPPHVGALCD